VGGIIFADHSIRANPDSLMAIAGLGMIATVFGIGYALNIKNPFRFGLALVGGAGLGLLLRGGATMF
jgi:NhaP-type Na+/H+ or K+/H+ antiporter